MMDWKDLSLKEQKVAETIENIYLHYNHISKEEFLRSLFFIGNKYKTKKLVNENNNLQKERV